MTVVAGYWSLSARSDPQTSVAGMLSAQEIYAPGRNSAASWHSDDLALGRRLKRLLPEDRYDFGPVVSADGKRILVADLRLDNRQDLLSNLGISPENGRVLSDASVLMAALDRWEEGAVDRLRGDFAFVQWDLNRKRFLLARDYAGQRPLHYHRGDDFFAFASMPKGLHAIPEIPRAPDEQALVRFLALLPETGGQTFFEGIERVAPGHICTVTGSNFSTHAYWQPSRKTLRLLRNENYEEEIRQALDRAVSVRLRGSERTVGAHLSGGLDSSAVAATAAKLLGSDGKVVCFTAVPRTGYDGAVPHGRFGDEGPLAARVAAMYPNIEHILVPNTGKSPLAAIDRNFFLYDRPLLNLCNGVWSDAIMEQAKVRGLSVMLSGQMGNMSFSYTGLESLPEMLTQGRLLRLAREITLLPRNGIRMESALAHVIGPFLPRSLWRAINRWRGRHFRLQDYSAVNLSAAQLLEADATDAGLDFSYRPRRDPFGTRRWVIGRVDPGNYNKGFLAGWGVDLRDPSGDRDLVELCLSIPAEQYLQQGVPRSLARRAFADRLPAAILVEQRKGLQAIDWHEGLSAAREETQAEIDRIAAVPSSQSLLDLEKLNKLVENWPQTGWNSNQVMSGYRLALLRGVSGGHFLRKAKGSNA